jgi:hypothetical protein
VVVCIHLCIIWNLMVYLLPVWETVRSGIDLYVINLFCMIFLFLCRREISFLESYSLLGECICGQKHWSCSYAHEYAGKAVAKELKIYFS